MKARGIILTIIGVLTLTCGVANVIRAGAGPVLCDYEVMQPYDTCEVTTNGTTTSLTYDEMNSRDSVGDWMLVGVGVLVLVIGLLILLRASRKKAAEANAAPLPTA